MILRMPITKTPAGELLQARWQKLSNFCPDWWRWGICVFGGGFTTHDILRRSVRRSSDVGLDLCETVLIAPVTGVFGSAAVKVALAMGVM